MPAPHPRRHPLPWQAVRTLFERLVALPAAARREALKREAASTTLADEVWSLLGQHDAEEAAAGGGQAGFLDHPAWRHDLDATAAADAGATRPPTGGA
jgi:hypothetical protein